jgi:hypothetical protein
MNTPTCHECGFAAKVASATEAYFICMPKNEKSIEVHEKGCPEWCPLLEREDAPSA